MRVLFRRALLLVALTPCVTACGDGGPTPPSGPRPPSVERDGVTYLGRLTLALDHFLAAEVTLDNRSGASRTILFPDDCIVLLRAYGRRGRAWDQFNKTCLVEDVHEISLAAGDTAIFGTNALVHFILSDSLPEGVYAISAYLRPVGESEVEIFIGAAALKRDPDFAGLPDRGSRPAGAR